MNDIALTASAPKISVCRFDLAPRMRDQEMCKNHLQSLVSYDTPLETTGRVLMCGIPGIYIEESGILGLSESLLDAELIRLKELNVALLYGLIEDEELGSVAYEDIIDHANKRGIAIERFRIADYRVRSSRQASEWLDIFSDTTALLRKNKSVAFHCMAGIRRSGIMAGCVLTHLGMPPLMAVETIRVAQPEALNTAAQVSYLLSQQSLLSNADIKRTWHC